jgi:hypothetical protein
MHTIRQLGSCYFKVSTSSTDSSLYSIFNEEKMLHECKLDKTNEILNKILNVSRCINDYL